MEKIKVMIIDDDIYVRQALETLIRRHPQTDIYAVAGNVDEAVEILGSDAQKPDVIVLDVNFQGIKKTGIQSIVDIKPVSGDAKILVSSMNQDQDTVISAVQNDADGFVWKNESGDGIISAIIKLAEGRFVVTKTIAEKVIGQTVNLAKYVEILKERVEYKKLTEELRKTIYMYCYCGMSAKEIAEELNLSIHTVNSRIKTAYHLLNASSRSEAFGKLVEREI